MTLAARTITRTKNPSIAWYRDTISPTSDDYVAMMAFENSLNTAPGVTSFTVTTDSTTLVANLVYDPTYPGLSNIEAFLSNFATTMTNYNAYVANLSAYNISNNFTSTLTNVVL